MIAPASEAEAALWALAAPLALILLGVFNLFRMPGFFSHLPRPRRGEYVACAFRVTPFRQGTAVEVRCRGLLRTYLRARWEALKLDWRTPYWGGEAGIDWAVRNLTREERGAAVRPPPLEIYELKEEKEDAVE